MSNLDMDTIIFQLINYGGTAKSLAYEALEEAFAGKYDEADRLLKEAEEELNKAHDIQTGIIQEQAAGNKTEVSVLFVHAQDHLMTAMEAKHLIECIIRLKKGIDEK